MIRQIGKENKYNLADHPTEVNVVIVIDEAGNPISGKTIQVGDAIIGGDSDHGEAKGPTIKSPDGTRWRIKVANDGTVSAEQK